MALAIVLHLLAAVVWVGGMFFAYVCLRPAAMSLQPSLRLPLWSAVLGRFFPWVWAAVVVLLLTGYWMLFGVLGGFADAGWHIHLMQGLGIAMMLLFAHVYFAPYRRLQRAVVAGDWAAAGSGLNQIRKLVGINLTLGLIVVVVAAGGRYL